MQDLLNNKQATRKMRSLRAKPHRRADAWVVRVPVVPSVYPVTLLKISPSARRPPKYPCTWTIRSIISGTRQSTRPRHEVEGPSNAEGGLESPFGTPLSKNPFGIFLKSLYKTKGPPQQERPHHGDSTASRLLSEVKHRRAQLVLRWGTTLESSGVVLLRLLAFVSWRKMEVNDLRASFFPLRIHMVVSFLGSSTTVGARLVIQWGTRLVLRWRNRAG